MLMKCLLRVMGILSVWSMPIQMTLRSKNIFMGSWGKFIIYGLGTDEKNWVGQTGKQQQQ